MIEFDCLEKFQNELKEGDYVVVVEDIYYCDKDNCDDETWEDYKKFMKIVDDGFAYIPEGSVMMYGGLRYSCWPTFLINGYELDFASEEPLKLVKIKGERK